MKAKQIRKLTGKLIGNRQIVKFPIANQPDFMIRAGCDARVMPESHSVPHFVPVMAEFGRFASFQDVEEGHRNVPRKPEGRFDISCMHYA
jgi:hypothetical protein